MLGLSNEIDTITVQRFMNCLRGTGKTSIMIEAVKNFIDDTLLFKSDFEVLFIVPTVGEKKLIRNLFSDFYKKHIEFKTVSDILYQLSTFPIDTEHPYDVPQIRNLIRHEGKPYERYFVDPSCYERLCREQMDKIEKVKEIL